MDWEHEHLVVHRARLADELDAAGLAR
jgi:hypothetical protein